MGLHSDQSEIGFHDCVAGEYHSVMGTPTNYYSLRRSNETMNPTYDEPREENFDVFQVAGIYDFPEVTQEAQESGLATKRDNTISFARVQLEAAQVPFPKPGDVVEVPAGAGKFYTLEHVQPDGYINEIGTFTGFTCRMVRRDQFVPERLTMSSR